MMIALRTYAVQLAVLETDGGEPSHINDNIRRPPARTHASENRTDQNRKANIRKG